MRATNAWFACQQLSAARWLVILSRQSSEPTLHQLGIHRCRQHLRSRLADGIVTNAFSLNQEAHCHHHYATRSEQSVTSVRFYISAEPSLEQDQATLRMMAKTARPEQSGPKRNGLRTTTTKPERNANHLRIYGVHGDSHR